MKVSLHLNPKRRIDDVISISKFIDSNKWHSIYMPDHLMNHHVGDENNLLECWTTLALIASNTEDIKLSSLVSPISFRHPGLLVKTVTNVDQISKGRVTLGIGAGWYRPEHYSHGIDLLNPLNRIDKFHEGVLTIQGLLNNDKFTYNGKYFNFKNAECAPKKYKNNIPIMIGCRDGKKRITNLGMKYGDVINFIGSASYLNSVLDNDLKFNSTIIKNTLNPIILYDLETKKILEEYPHARVDRYSIINYRQLVDEIKLFKKIGFDEIIIGDISFLKNEHLFIILDYIKKEIESI